ncbi:ricin-type beta-trefoil lectin domain protein [Lentzea albida]|uniref:Ricin-type beta-trefoil lectin domain-containing protein n=1 Tax=Lentzea albida TaxID=65499 RepID=A0A1H9SC92_9PSEU|nr:ricin-type beta-trefoil lectin domain protein [Lentzea albida]SER81993.1 Ricin-type beta-trefoil lectin domain-containing protein [Lentzea albida]
MLKQRFAARFFGVLAALTLLFGASPAVAAQQDAVVLADHYAVWRNQGLPNMCMANHHPTVFMHYGPSSGSGFCGQYDDQFWIRYSDLGMIQNKFSNGCLATHGGAVFTSDCNSGYRDQRWAPYPPDPGLLENRQYPGNCLAAHANGNVFISPCNSNYNDQRWIRG